MNLIKSLLIITVFVFLGCKKNTELHEEKSNVVLIAYEINTPSRIWLKEIDKDKIHEVVISKYRREPSINLNDTITITIAKDNSDKINYIKGENIFKVPNDSLNKIVSLDKYYKVYKKY